MDINFSELTSKVTNLLLPFLRKNKVISKINEDFKEAGSTSLLELWEKIKPIFIEEFEEENGELDQDVINEAILRRELKKKLKGNEDFANTIARILKNVEQEVPKTNIGISNSKNIAIGNKIDAGGDVIIGGKKSGKK